MLTMKVGIRKVVENADRDSQKIYFTIFNLTGFLTILYSLSFFLNELKGFI